MKAEENPLFRLEIGNIAAETSSGPGFEYIKLAAEFFQAIAWPLAVILVVLIFRRQLVNLASRVRQFSGPGGINATFGDELERTREIAESATASLGPETSSLTAPIDNPATEMAQTFPEAAVLHAYLQIERVLREISPVQGISPMNLLNALHSLGVVPTDVQTLFDQIRRTRNAAVHSERPITAGEALEFQALVRQFLEALRSRLPLDEETIGALADRFPGRTSMAR